MTRAALALLLLLAGCDDVKISSREDQMEIGILRAEVNVLKLRLDAAERRIEHEHEFTSKTLNLTEAIHNRMGVLQKQVNDNADVYNKHRH